ncbi:DUF2059 domain-containing protein [Paracoccus sp. EGI L200073]|nr:DUF2059 domain-containing protein [Paracoccus salsus]
MAVLCASVAMSQQKPVPPEAAAEAAGRQELVDRIWEVMELDQLMPILQHEALAEADALEDGMPGGVGDDGWTEAVSQIHQPARLRALFEAGLRQKLAGPVDPRLDAALEFYRSALGRRLIGLEMSTRQAMLEPEIEASARQAFSAAASRGDPRVDQIARLIEQADLVGPNVAGGMNAAVAFSQGFADGGGFDMPMTRDQILADAWSQEAELGARTRVWIESYLLLAYAPLSDAELETCIRFASSPAGKALSAALFAGFEAMFMQTSRDMGLAAAAQMQGQRL